MSILKDKFGRTFPYIRMSITDVCNFKCGYCLPNGYQVDKSDNRKFLHLDEIRRLSKCFSLLGVNKIYLGIEKKEIAFNDFTETLNIDPKEVLYMGDDVADIAVMEKVGVATCPQDAVSDVKKIVDYVSHKKGGDGCVREIMEQVMRVQNKWIL